MTAAFPSLADFSHDELVLLCDEHDDAAFGVMIANHPAMRQGEDFYDFLSGLPNPFGNMVFGMNVPNPAETVADVTKRLAASGAPAYWWVGPCTQPKDLNKILEKHGWIEQEETPCMILDLAELRGDVMPGLSLREVKTEEDLRDWQEVFARGYEVPLEIGRALAPDLNGSVRLFTATLNGEAVGTTGIFVHRDVPGVYCVSTVPEFRKSGIGAAITAMPLLQAREEGYQMATLQASSRGHSVYKRLGFKDVCHLRVFAMNL